MKDIATICCWMLIIYPALTTAILCYECASDSGEDCLGSTTTCSYGFFGCMKVVTYSGGIDKYGNNHPDVERQIITMNRGCTLLPLSRTDICRQVSFFGYRLQTCYCFNDFCNRSSTYFLPFLLIIVLAISYIY